MRTADGEMVLCAIVGLYPDSLGLQHGVPMSSYVSKFRGMRFEPSGRTFDQPPHVVTSLLDMLAEWLARTFPENAT